MSRRVPRHRRDPITPDPFRPDPFTAEALVEVLGAVRQTPVTVGFDVRGAELQLHLAPLPPDHRAGSAGLFGLRAPEEWFAVGAVAGGVAGDIESRRVLSHDAVIRVVVTRGGEVASLTTIDGTVVDGTGDDLPGHPGSPPGPAPVPRPDDPTGLSQGLLVDCLHRVLGLPSPGEPPALTTLAWHVWLTDVFHAAAAGGGIGRAEAAGLHPGQPGRSSVGPSVETLTQATLQAAAESDWHGMHRRAAAGRFRGAELSADELRWMDTTLFARWAFSCLPDADLALDVLRTLGCGEVAQMLIEVRTAVEREVSRGRSTGDDGRTAA